MTTVSIEELLNAVYQVTLQFIYIGKMFILHSLSTLRARFPCRLASLITTDMDIFWRKKFHDFGQHIFEKGKGFFITDTEVRILVRLARTGQLRISSQHFFRMGRHFYFRDDRHVMLTGIFKYFTNVFLSIITAGSSGFIEVNVFASTVPPFLPVRLRTPSGKVSEQRVFPYLNAPACRISQMQMKPVYFIKSQCVYLLLHKFFGEEMAGNIEHKTTISKTRSILYFNGCDGIARARRGKQL